MFTKALLAAALLGVSHAQVNPGGGAAMMRFACSQLVVERLDPLVNPGVIGTPHVHQIVGGNSFKPSMTPVAYDLPSRSNCTSCTFSEYVASLLHVFISLDTYLETRDFSNYWTAALYYKARNGTYKRVGQFANGGLVQNGGVTVYYIPPYDGVTNVTAFKPVSRSCLRLGLDSDLS
jgi:hypothetical protein